MPEDQEAREPRPLEKREIRGLTIESLLRYGGMIVAIVVAAYLLKGKVDANATAIIENGGRLERIEKRLDALEIRQNTDDVKNARFEEQLKNQK